MKPNQTVDIGTPLDLKKFITTRGLIQASSGGGKSWAIRKLAEKAVPLAQVILIDPESEFSSLRQKFPFALVSKEGGDIPLSVRHAETLAHKLLETGLSAIIDLSELEPHQRQSFVKAFCNALIESPKDLHHELLLIIDEADQYAPEGKESESTRAVINVASRGRKRGISLVLATQRIAKLSKNACADLLNKMIGLTGLDTDQKRAGAELGFSSKEEITSLRKLKPGEFYVFGPAFGYDVKKIKVGKVETAHQEVGQHWNRTTATPHAIKKILLKLANMPEEAERDLNTKQELQREVTRLSNEIKVYKKAIPDPGKPSVDERVFKKLQQRVNEDDKKIISLIEERAVLLRQVGAYKKYYDKVAMQIRNLNAIEQPVVETPVVVVSKIAKGASKGRLNEQFRGASIIDDVSEKTGGVVQKKTPVYTGTSAINLVSGAMRMLKAAAMFFPNPISRTRMSAFAKMTHTGGSFGTYISLLRAQGLITGDKTAYLITEPGLAAAGDVDPLPTDPQELINLWCSIIGENGGTARMLRVLGSHYPDFISRDQLAEEAGLTRSAGSFGTYFSYLKSRELIVVSKNDVKASDELFL